MPPHGTGSPLPPRYLVGHDPAGWLAVHPENGLVMARDHLDRESPFAKNSTYAAVLLAVDDGEGCERGPCSHRPACRARAAVTGRRTLALARRGAGGCLSPPLLGASPSL